VSPLDEAPGEYCLSKLQGISMHGLWEVLIVCNLAKEKGKQGDILDRTDILPFATNNGLTNAVILVIEDRQLVLCIAIFT
jgi:hypothetical protein